MSETREQRVAAARARMAELAEKFVTRSRDELVTLRSNWARLEHGDVGALEDILMLTHRMSGTGATLGFDAISTCARNVELIAKAHAGTSPDPGVVRQLETAIEQLAAVIPG